MDIRARDLLTQMRENSNIVIAGGAARDEYYGKQPRDYDIFVPNGTWKAAGDVFDKLGIKIKAKSGEEYGPQAVNKKGWIRSVWGFTYEGLTFDMIYTKLENKEDFGLQLVHNFDMSINMIWTEDGKNLLGSKEFQHGVTNQTNTVHNMTDLAQLWKRQERHQKIMTKIERLYKFKVPGLSYTPPEVKFVDESVEVQPIREFGFGDDAGGRAVGHDPLRVAEPVIRPAQRVVPPIPAGWDVLDNIIPRLDEAPNVRIRNEALDQMVREEIHRIEQNDQDEHF